MSNEVHGHEVMKMMITSGENYTRASLREAIISQFGADARFYTCSASDLTADGLIDFLAERGKFNDAGNESVSMTPDKMCNH